MRKQISNKVFIVFSTYEKKKKEKVSKVVLSVLAECSVFKFVSPVEKLSIFEMIIVEGK